MKALVLSGGLGTRMRPLSHSMAKQLMPIANKPVLEYVLENIRDIGITQIGVVVGDHRAQIAEVIGDGSRFGARITYLTQERPLGLGHGVAVARRFLGSEDFVVYLGDNMLPGGIKAAADEFAARRPAAQIVVHKVPDPRAFGVAEIGQDGAVLRLAEKPSRPRSDLALVGVYFFTDIIHSAVAAARFSERGEMEITDAIQWLLDHGSEVRAHEYVGYWKDAGSPEGVLECSRHVLRDLRRSIAGRSDFASDLDGQVVLGPGARVLRSRVEGPAIIGPGTLIVDSQVGPFTSIGRDCLLRATRIADSIMLDESSIGHTDLRDAIIGRSATVEACRQGHALQGVVLGDDSRIEIACCPSHPLPHHQCHASALRPASQRQPMAPSEQ